MKKILIFILFTIGVLATLLTIKANADRVITIKYLNESGYYSSYTITVPEGNTVNLDITLADDEVVVNWIKDGQTTGNQQTNYTFNITDDHKIIGIKRKTTNYVALFFNDSPLSSSDLVGYKYYTKQTIINELIPFPEAQVPEGKMFAKWSPDWISSYIYEDIYLYPEFLDLDGTAKEFYFDYEENDDKSASITYKNVGGSKIFNFMIPTYQYGVDGCYSGFVKNIVNGSDNTIKMEYHPKINHGVAVDKTFDFFVVRDMGTLTDYSISTNEIDYIHFFDAEASVYVSGIKLTDGHPINKFNMQLKNDDRFIVYYANAQEANTLEDLPITNGDKYPANIQTITGGYKVNISHGTSLYSINMTDLPVWLVNAKKIHYYTNELNDRLLVGFYNGYYPFRDHSNYQTNLLENSWIIYNLTTNNYRQSDYNTIHAKLSARGDGKLTHNLLYAEIVIPHRLDQLLAISISYSYKYRYLDGSKSKEPIKVEEQLLNKDYTKAIDLPWYMSFATAWLGYAYNSVNRQTKYISEADIEEIQVDSAYKTAYVEWLEEHGSGQYSVNEVFPPGSKAYDLFLGQFNKMWSTGVWVEEFAVISYRYEVDGQTFSNPFPFTVAPPMDEAPSILPDLKSPIENFLEQLWTFFLKFMWVIVIIAALVTINIPMKIATNIFGPKAKRNRAMITIIWVGGILLVWYLFMKSTGNL